MSSFSVLVLPRPDTRLVLFGDMVFKIMYKLSPVSENKYTRDYHGDIMRLTKGVLKTLTNNNKIHSLRTDDVVVFTGLTPWELGQQLQFTEYGRPLAVYSDTVLIVIHILDKSTVTKRRFDYNNNNDDKSKRRRINNKMELLFEDTIYPVTTTNESFGNKSIFIKYILNPIMKIFKWK